MDFCVIDIDDLLWIKNISSSFYKCLEGLGRIKKVQKIDQRWSALGFDGNIYHIVNRDHYFKVFRVEDAIDFVETENFLCCLFSDGSIKCWEKIAHYGAYRYELTPFIQEDVSSINMGSHSYDIMTTTKIGSIRGCNIRTAKYEILYNSEITGIAAVNIYKAPNGILCAILENGKFHCLSNVLMRNFVAVEFSGIINDIKYSQSSPYILDDQGFLFAKESRIFRDFYYPNIQYVPLKLSTLDSTYQYLPLNLSTLEEPDEHFSTNLDTNFVKTTNQRIKSITENRNKILFLDYDGSLWCGEHPRWTQITLPTKIKSLPNESIKIPVFSEPKSARKF